jgi:hypothetical protein
MLTTTWDGRATQHPGRDGGRDSPRGIRADGRSPTKNDEPAAVTQLLDHPTATGRTP